MLAYALGGSRLAWLIGLSLLAVATHALAAVMGLRLLPVPQVSGSPAGMVALLVALAAELVLWLLAMKLAVEALRHGAAGHGVDAADAVVEDGVALRHLVLWLALAVAGFLAWRLAGRAAFGLYLFAACALLPALLSLLTMEDSLWRAFDPRAWWELLSRSGPNYLACAGRLAVLFGGGFALALLLHGALPGGLAAGPARFLSLLGLVSGYHALGLWLHRQRDEFGLPAPMPLPRSRLASFDEDAAMAEADALAADDPATAATRLLPVLRGRGGSAPVHARYRELLQAAGDRDALLMHDREYVAVLLALGQERPALSLYLAARALDSGFELEGPDELGQLVRLTERIGQSQLSLALALEYLRRFPRTRDAVTHALRLAQRVHEHPERTREARAVLVEVLARHPDHAAHAELEHALACAARLKARCRRVRRLNGFPHSGPAGPRGRTLRHLPPLRRVLRALDAMDPSKPPPPHVQSQAPSTAPVPEVTDHDFRLMVDSIADYAIFLLDAGGHVRTWNAGAERIKGYLPEEIIGQHFTVFYPPEQVARRWPDYELEMARKEGRFEDEGWRVRKDGSRFWANIVITRLLDEEGVLRGFSKVTRDLTERRMHEQMLRRSEERFRLLVEGVQDYAIFLLDPEGHVSTWNPGAQRTKGYRPEEILGKHLSTFYPPELAASGWAGQVLALALQNGRFEEEGWRVRKDGTRFWASVVITPLFDERGNHRGFAKVTRDLTDKRRIRHLEDEGRRITTFLAMLAHELRNPLAPMANALSILRVAGKDEAATATAREVLGRQLTQIIRLVDDLLDVGRITSGKVLLERELLPLGSLVYEAVEAIRPQAEVKSLDLAMTSEGPGPWVSGDRTRLLQLVGNLLANAVKFTPEHGRIEVALRRQTGLAELSVRDSGAGVPAHLTEEIFRPFVQGEQDVARSQGGLGLGLALVQQIAELHGGTVAVYAASPGGGAEFVVTLPLAEPPTDRLPAPGAAPQRQLRVRARGLLVVDDNVDAANTLRIVLEAVGYRVRVAYDGPTALALARETRPEALLLDIGLPGVSGLEVARALRSDPGPTPKLVAVTGYGAAEDRAATAEAGFDLHLVKPVDLAALTQALEKLLD